MPGASTFVLPEPNVSSLRAGARWARRYLIRRRRDLAVGEARKKRNTDLNLREFWHGRDILKSYPRIVQVGTNWTCNLKCSFCRLTMDWTQRELKRKPARELAISEKVESVLAELLPYAQMVTLTPLGEPLMWGGLTPLLERHQRLGCRNLGLTSNGMLLSDKMAEKLVRSELQTLFVSIDSNDPEVYAAMRVGGDLRTVEEGIGRLNAWKEKLGVPWPRLILASTFMERNISQLPSMVGWAQRLGFEELSVQLMEIENPDQEGEFLGHHVELTYRMLTEAMGESRRLGMKTTPHLALKNLLSAASEAREVGDHRFEAASPTMPEEKKRIEGAGGNGSYGSDDSLAGVTLDENLDMRDKTLIEKCYRPWYYLLVDTDGDARACCWVGASWPNLNDTPLDEVWNGDKARTMRRRFLNDSIPPECRGKHCRVDL